LPETPEHYGYSLVLGNPSITLIDLVYSYSKLLDFSDPNKFLLYQILSNPDNRDISF
jgi:membrane carboxypeptidase/penicillin-binding protein PbpC